MRRDEFVGQPPGTLSHAPARGATLPPAPRTFQHAYLKKIAATPGGYPAYERAHLVKGTKTVASKLRLPARPARLVAEYWLHAGFY